MKGEYTAKKGLLGTGEQLRAHINEQIVKDTMPTDHIFSIYMNSLLANSIDNAVVPMGFVIATETLIYDCQEGVSGSTGEPMPNSVIGMPPFMYNMFRIQAQIIARDAFGDEFGDQVDQAYESIIARAEKPIDPTV